MKKTCLFLTILLVLCLLVGCGKAPAAPVEPEQTKTPEISEEAAPPEENEPAEESALPLLSAQFADDSVLQSGSGHLYTVEESEYTQYIALWAGEPVTDFCLQSMLLDDSGYSADAVLHRVEKLNPETPFIAGVVFYGDMTGYGFSFTDSSGVPHRYVVTLSGMDGSLVLEELTPAG